MKKPIALIIAACVLVCGCGSGVSQEEYNAVIEERDAFKSNGEKMNKITELKVRVAEYQAKIDAEYEHAKFVIYVAGNASGNDIEESTNDAKEVRDKAINSIDSAKSVLEKVNSEIEIDEELIKTAQETVDGMLESWENYYAKVIEVEKYIMGE